jgi:hypothetical protein
MKKCLFCPNQADSLEHVLPQWLFRRVVPSTAGKFPVRVGRYVHGEGSRDVRRHLSLNFKARIVCQVCNNGWMSQLESRAARTLHPLLAESFPVLGRSFLDSLRQDATLIALWLSKTALTTSMALPGSKRFPPAFAEQIAQQQPPLGVWVDLASAKATGIGAAFTNMFPTINGNVFVGAKTHATGACFHFCLQINQLLLRVGMTPGARVGYIAPGGIPFRLYPNPDLRVPANLQFPDLNHFCHSVILRTWAGCRGEVPNLSVDAQPES